MATRRRFLLIAAGVVVAAAVGVVGIVPSMTESQIVTHVRRRLSFLKLDEAGLQAFARDQVAALLAKRPTWNRMKYHFFALFTNSFTKYDRSNDRRSRIERMTDQFASTYLLSSDFFINGADAARLVRYLRLYDPLRACSNPFARPVVDTSNSVSPVPGVGGPPTSS
jgi:hypothetical protein